MKFLEIDQNSNIAFYSDDINAPIPSTAKPIADDLWADYLAHPDKYLGDYASQSLVAAPPPPIVLPGADPGKLLESLRGDPLFLKALAAGSQGAGVGMFVALINSELKSPNFDEHDFDFALNGLVQAMGQSITAGDKQQVNAKLSSAGFTLQI